jgi:LPS export ABC transporter permease LptF/LPS export ABC transporter permease LptG
MGLKRQILFRHNFKFIRLLIPRYIIGATLPYVLLSLLMLTAVLFTQQVGRLAEVLLYTDLPFSLLASIGATLLPGVLTFTIPLATLAGLIIGFSRMGTDSEIVAMRAAGVGSWTMLWPALLIGFILTGATTYIHLKEAPQAARDLERIALQGALAKLDSPVEPRTFSTLPRYVIYVRDGDKVLGTWGRVFIFQQSDRSNQIFTARTGRIDSSGDKSELVLSDVLATKFPTSTVEDQKEYVVERFDQLRIAINTGRADLMERINQREGNADSMEWDELRKLAATGSAQEMREAQRILNRRIALSVAPLVFSLLAATLGLRVRRGGKSIGVLLALLIVVVYYLTSLLGESLSRAGTISPVVGPWIATALMLCLSLWLLAINRIPLLSLRRVMKRAPATSRQSATKTWQGHTRGIGSWGFPNLMDASLFRTLALSFLVSFIALVAIFDIFTLFELWRFIAVNQASAVLVGRYLLFLLPLIAVELFPATMLISVLITYALMTRRREAIAWWACGQSVYRLMLPGLFFALAIGWCSWLVQEHLMPAANLKQDAIRGRIKGGEARAITGTGRQWLASTVTHRLYSYEFEDEQGTLREPVVYELDDEAVHLAKVVSAKGAAWPDPNHIKLVDTETLALRGMEVERQSQPEITLGNVEASNVFRPGIDKPSQLSAVGLKNYLSAAQQRGLDVSALAVSLQRKYAGPFSIVVMALIGMPLAISFGRKGTIIALCAAIVVSIAYWGVGGGFQQLGNHGLLRPAVAGWSPLLIFTAAGTYFLSKVRT